ncbi:NAD(P)H-dependent oxidoreductase [Ferrovibrio sp.]|uniref:NADPH-dependent FMN reductase n=1 Tax=Ferrovibrio sp. TaxID=1917215 RepID=UPI00311D3E54
MTTTDIRVAALCGSLRKDSYNAAALRAAIELAPAGMTIRPAPVGDLPLYNDDIRQAGYPEPVARLRQALGEADAVLFVTPEYNFSVPGVLKNAIDWASRPPSQPFDGKPVAIMGAATGVIGTARAQYHLRQMMVFLNAFPVNKPEVFIGQAASKFDAGGNLTDQPTRDIIAQLLAALQAWTLKLRG